MAEINVKNQTEVLESEPVAWIYTVKYGRKEGKGFTCDEVMLTPPEQNPKLAALSVAITPLYKRI